MCLNGRINLKNSVKSKRRVLFLTFLLSTIFVSFQNCSDVKFQKKQQPEVIIEPGPTALTAELIPSQQTKTEGEPFTIVTSLSGTESQNIEYRWFFGGTRVSNMNGKNYIISRSTLADSGSYSVEIWIDGSKEKTIQGTVTITAAAPPAPPTDALIPFESCYQLPDSENLNSCKQYKDHALYDAEGTGCYWVDPDGTEGDDAPFKVHCEMDKYDGGWTQDFSVALATNQYKATLYNKFKSLESAETDFDSEGSYLLNKWCENVPYSQITTELGRYELMAVVDGYAMIQDGSTMKPYNSSYWSSQCDIRTNGAHGNASNTFNSVLLNGIPTQAKGLLLWKGGATSSSVHVQLDSGYGTLGGYDARSGHTDATPIGKTTTFFGCGKSAVSCTIRQSWIKIYWREKE